MDYRLERSGEDPVRFGRRHRTEEGSDDVGGTERGGVTAVSPPRRTPGAIYLANLCHVIGNFIIFLEASQSRQPGARHSAGRTIERKVEKDGCGGGLYGWDTAEGRQPLGKMDILFLRAATRRMKNAHG